MKMDIKGKTSAFTKMLMVASLSKTFNEIVMEPKDKEILIQIRSDSEQAAISSKLRFFGFEISGTPEKIGLNVTKVLGYLKDIFKGEDEIVWTVDSGDLIISGGLDVVKIALLEPKNIKTYAEKLQFQIDETDKVALYKKGTLKPTTKATLNSEIFKGISMRAAKVGQEYYPIELIPPNKFQCSVGSRSKDKTNDTIDYKREDILVEGTEMRTILGFGFKEMAAVLDGDIMVSGVDESVFKKPAPLWVYQCTDEHEIGFFIAPRAEE